MVQTKEHAKLNFFWRASSFLLTVIALLLTAVYAFEFFFFHSDYNFKGFENIPRLSSNKWFNICDWVKVCGDSENSMFVKIAWNYFTLGIFFLQHFYMANESFKSFMKGIFSGYDRIERSIYNLSSSLLVLLHYFTWQPLVYFNFELPESFLVPLICFKVLLCVLLSIAVMQIDMLALKKFFFYAIKGDATYFEEFHLVKSFLYRISRNPIQIVVNLNFISPMNFNIGTLISFLGLVLFQIPTSRQEQKVLKKQKDYEDYAKGVPMFVPTKLSGSEAKTKQKKK